MFETNDRKKELAKFYLELMKENNIAASREATSFQKLWLTITSGTLVLSVTFLVNLIQNSKILAVEILILSWICLTASIIIGIFSFIFVGKHFQKRGKEITKWFKNDAKIEIEDENVWTKITHGCNHSSLILTIVGLISFAYFGYLNVLSLIK